MCEDRLSKMSEETTRVAEGYVAGASLAFGVVLLTQEGVGAYYAWAGVGPEAISGGYVLALFVVAHFVGGFLGGLLARRRSGEDTLRAGGVTALLAFVIEALYNFVFAGTFFGNILAIGILVTGSIIGAASASRSLRS